MTCVLLTLGIIAVVETPFRIRAAKARQVAILFGWKSVTVFSRLKPWIGRTFLEFISSVELLAIT